MRRSSILTIILLVLVIIGLIVALVFTNLPDKKQVEGNEITNDGDNVQEDKIKTEEPTQVALEGEVIEKIFDILNLSESYSTVKKGEATIDDVDNKEIQKIAFKLYIENNYEKIDTTYVDDYMVAGKYSREDMDEAVKKVFGEIKYTPSDFGTNIIPLSIYVESEQTYYVTSGYGGGGYYSYPIKGITKVDEYSDRYEVYEDYLYAQSSSREGKTVYILKGWHSDLSKQLTVFEPGKEAESIAKYNDIEPKGIYVGKVSAKDSSIIELQELELLKTRKILTKYQDDATVYKHTFMKNEDGSFYWYKSEIVK